MRGFTYLSHSLSCPTVSSHPGRILAARTGEMQHIPRGFPALWNALMSFSMSGWTAQFLLFTAQSQRFFAAPKPPETQRIRRVIRTENKNESVAGLPGMITASNADMFNSTRSVTSPLAMRALSCKMFLFSVGLPSQ